VGVVEHRLQLYQEEHCLLEALGAFVGAGLRLEEGVVFIGSTPRWQLLLDRLQKDGVDAHAQVGRGQLRHVGPHILLSSLHSRQRFNEIMGSALSLARARFERVRVFSELTDALWREGQRANARVIETYWQPLLGVHEFELLCACPIDSLEGQAYDGSLQALCATHTHVHPAFDEEGFEQAVSGAIDEVLDSQLVRMLHTLSLAHRPAAHMPPGQAMLFWLKDNMPRTAERVLSRARARWSEH
jgi:MEDS: MEthanogen/methylotroph, DcmR Sensory domain